ncbi:HB2L protein, partial [Dicaeum eximium]|nr:HB2L protein [Dicaeum eximium]
GARPELAPARTAVFQYMVRNECHFTNGTEKVRALQRYIYNREQLLHFDSDAGHFVGDTPFGERNARRLNSDAEKLQYYRTAVDAFCRKNFQVFAPVLVQRRAPPSPSQSLPAHPSP